MIVRMIRALFADDAAETIGRTNRQKRIEPHLRKSGSVVLVERDAARDDGHRNGNACSGSDHRRGRRRCLSRIADSENAKALINERRYFTSEPPLELAAC